MSADCLFTITTAKYQWRFEIVTWQGRDSFRIWPYYKTASGEWACCKKEFIRGDAPHIPLDELTALIAALQSHAGSKLKLIA